MSDERYERSADMRLLELQREALGVAKRVVGSTKYTDPEFVADFLRDDESPVPGASGTILVAAIDAHPRSGLIAGALVTISLSVYNEGDAPAANVSMSLPLPADTAYRPGTFTLDGTVAADAVAVELFGNGAPLGDITPGSRRTIIVKLSIDAGLHDIILSPHLSAASGAILGLRAIRLTRAAMPAASAVRERPFYETDDGERTQEPGELPARSSTFTVVQPREFPPLIEPAATVVVPEPASVSPARVLSPAPEPAPATATPASTVKIVRERKAKPKAKPRPRAKPEATSIAASNPAPVAATIPAVNGTRTPSPKVVVVRSVEDAVSIVGQGGPILTVSIDRRRLATLGQLFGGESLGMVAHYLLLNALAVTHVLPGDPTEDRIAAFVTNQEQLLSRALITTRLGKAPAVTALGAILPPFPGGLVAHDDTATLQTPPAGEARLVRAFQSTEIVFLGRMLSNENAAQFLRATQLFVGLCANDVVSADERQRRTLRAALTTYTPQATSEISRIFLRAKLTRSPELFKATDISFDDAARAVLAALGQIIG